MVSSISGGNGAAALSAYLQQLQNNKTNGSLPPLNNSTGSSLVTSLLGGSGNTNAIDSSLLGAVTSQLSPQALLLLQQINGSSSDNPISDLFSGTSSSDPLTSAYTNLYASIVGSASTAAAGNVTQQQKLDQAAAVDPLQAVLSDYSQAINGQDDSNNGPVDISA